jgi:hypothetical protein
MSKRLALQIVLWAICLYHVVLGGGAFLSEDVAAWLAELLFSIKLEPTPQLSYVVKLLGVYALVFGLVSGTAALAPERHPTLLNLVIALYALRVLNKLVFSELFTRAFAAPPARTWIDIAMLTAFGLAVALLKPRKAVGGGA